MKTKQIFYPLTASLFFSGSFVAAKIATYELGPLTITLLRYVIALLFLAVLVYPNKQLSLKIKPKDLPGLILLGLFGIVGYHYFFFVSLKFTTLVNTANINATSPLITALLASFLIKERLAKQNYAGILLAFVGVILLLSRGEIGTLLGFKINSGDGLMFLAVLSWAIYAILIKILIKTYSSFTLTFYATFFGVVVLLFLAPIENFTQQIYTISSSTLLAILYMGIFASGLGYLYYNKSIKIIGPTKTASFTYSAAPILVAGLGWFVFGQSITIVIVICMISIILGLRLMWEDKKEIMHR